MGRAGRGGGGGGSFGGSRGFSSHSGGGSHRSSHSSSRSSWSSSSSHHSSWGSSYHRHYNSGPRFYYFGGTRYSSGSTGGGYQRSSAGCSSTVWTIIAIIIMAAVILEALFPDFAEEYEQEENTSITRSTVERHKYENAEKYYINDMWYTDELDWIKRPSTLETGMQHFYDKTGIQPYLYITGEYFSSSADIQKRCEELYNELFNDEAHLLLLFSEHNEQYKTGCMVGAEAKTVMDEEAREILLDYIDHYYYSNYDEDEFFSRAFGEAADRLMRVTPRYEWIAAIFVIVLIIVIVLFLWWKKKKQHKLDEMKQAQDILNADLNEFGGPSAASYDSTEASSNVEELKKKYDDPS